MLAASRRAGLTAMALAAAVLGSAGCGFNPMGGAAADDVVDPDGGDDGGDDGGGTCVDHCEADALVTCTDGVPNTPVTCTAGCLETGGPHCAVLIPSNGAGAGDLIGVTGDLVVGAGQVVVIDGDDGSIELYIGGNPPMSIRDPGIGLGDMIRFRTLAQATGAPQLAIFGVKSLSIASGGRLRTTGDRVIVILAAETAMIAGIVDAGAGKSGATGTIDCQECPGAGGGDGSTRLADSTGCAPGLDGNYYTTMDETGGGGGGLAGSGGRGGDSNAGAAVGGNVTPITGCPGATLVPIEGGSGGGTGAATVTSGGEVGGGGGGAVQITALISITVTATGDLYAGGAGGVGSLDNYGGGAGGAGGALLLEAPNISLASMARITANGGGGGSGREANRGENGARALQRASGGAGTGAGLDEGRGGLGGIGTGTMQPATAGNGTIDGTGGGGGGQGIIRINAVTPLLLPSGVVISPAHSSGLPARQ